MYIQNNDQGKRMILIKPLIIVITACLIMVSLGGCVTLNKTVHPTPDEIAQHRARQTKCDKADYLLANLDQPVDKRVYSLKPGVRCDAHS